MSVSYLQVYREIEKKVDKSVPASTSYSASSVEGTNEPFRFEGLELEGGVWVPQPTASGDIGTGTADVQPGTSRLVEQARERQLVGSLTASVRFKEGGLVKRVCIFRRGSVRSQLFDTELAPFFGSQDNVCEHQRGCSTPRILLYFGGRDERPLTNPIEFARASSFGD